jgi:hypothetical protein
MPRPTRPAGQSLFERIFGAAYARRIDGDAPMTIAAVSSFEAAADALRCAKCGGEAVKHFRLDRLSDGSARLACRRCCTELAIINADMMTLD